MKLLLTTVFLGYALYSFVFGANPFILYADKTTVSATPVQSETKVPEFTFKDYTIIPLANFEIEARVLSKRLYDNDKESDLSPIDLALGWGPMSKNSIIRNIDISQENRWYFWQTSSLPIPRKAIETNSANIHIIPANTDIANELKQINNGHIIQLTGYLVECQQKHWKWRSSTTRNDTGNGACEIIYAKSLSIKSVQ